MSIISPFSQFDHAKSPSDFFHGEIGFTLKVHPVDVISSDLVSEVLNMDPSFPS